MVKSTSNFFSIVEKNLQNSLLSLRQPWLQDLAHLYSAFIIDRIGKIFLSLKMFSNELFEGKGPSVRKPHFDVSSEASEISLPLNKRIPQRKVLGQSHQGIIDRGISMRMILAKNCSNHSRAFLKRFVMCHPHFAHSVEDSPMDWFEAVAHVRQRPSNDNRHRIIEVALSHFFLDFARFGAILRCCVSHMFSVEKKALLDAGKSARKFIRVSVKNEAKSA